MWADSLLRENGDDMIIHLVNQSNTISTKINLREGNTKHCVIFIAGCSLIIFFSLFICYHLFYYFSYYYLGVKGSSWFERLGMTKGMKVLVMQNMTKQLKKALYG